MRAQFVLEVAVVLVAPEERPLQHSPWTPRHMSAFSGRTEHARDRLCEGIPARPLRLKVSPTGRCQPVILRALLVFRELPLGVDQAALLEAVERRVQRSVVDVQHVLGAGANRDANPVAVLLAEA